MIKNNLTLLNDNDISDLLESGQWVEVELTKEEWKPLIGVAKIRPFYRLTANGYKKGYSLPLVLTLEVKSETGIIDDYTSKVEEEIYSGRDEIVLQSEVEEEIVEKENGLINVRPTFLALLYSLIPLRYNKNNISKITVDGVDIMSEEEYLRSKTSNPFTDLAKEYEEE